LFCKSALDVVEVDDNDNNLAEDDEVN